MEKRKSFWERLTGGAQMEEEVEDTKRISLGVNEKNKKNIQSEGKSHNNNWIEEENEEAELTVDVYQTPTDIIIQTMVAGVKPEDLELLIGRDIVTIRGKREESRTIDDENYFTKELYWGKFSRTISLPQEVEPEEAEATEKHGLLTLKLQKVDKEKTNNVKVRSI
jgi:HSP20 family molecular chaperone IbpA